MAVRIINVTITPQTAVVNQSVTMEVQVTEGSWATIKENYTSWETIKNTFENWLAIKNW